MIRSRSFSSKDKRSVQFSTLKTKIVDKSDKPSKNGFKNYFSLPRRKSKKQKEMTISLPIAVTGTGIVNQNTSSLADVTNDKHYNKHQVSDSSQHNYASYKKSSIASTYSDTTSNRNTNESNKKVSPMWKNNNLLHPDDNYYSKTISKGRDTNRSAFDEVDSGYEFEFQSHSPSGSSHIYDDYDTPSSKLASCNPSINSAEDYDFPKSSYGDYDLPSPNAKEKSSIFTVDSTEYTVYESPVYQNGEFSHYDNPRSYNKYANDDKRDGDYDVSSVKYGLTNGQDYDVPPSVKSGINSGEDYDVPSVKSGINSGEDYDVPPSVKSGINSGEDYDVPSVKSGINSGEDYDVPPSVKSSLINEDYDVPPSVKYGLNSGEDYDVPSVKSGLKNGEDYDVPPSVNSGLNNGEDYDVPPSLKSSLNHEDYDVPPSVKCGINNGDYDVPSWIESGLKSGEDYDVPPSVKSSLNHGEDYNVPSWIESVTKMVEGIDDPSSTKLPGILNRDSRFHQYTTSPKLFRRAPVNLESFSDSVDGIEFLGYPDDSTGRNLGHNISKDRKNSREKLNVSKRVPESVKKEDSSLDSTKESNRKSTDASSEENCVARALYDNSAESPDELAFRKGDMLTVLEQNTAGLEGWWLCSLRGRQGICPGNRLRLVPGCFDTGAGVTSNVSTPQLSRSPTPVGQYGGTLPHTPSGTNRNSCNKVITPKRMGDIYTYDTPRRHPLPAQSSFPVSSNFHPNMEYDVPPSRTQPYPVHGPEGSRLSRSSSLRYDSPRPSLRGSLEQHDIPLNQHYDIPKNQTTSTLYDSPKPQMATVPNKSLIKGVRTNANRDTYDKNLAEGQYDVPRPLHEHKLDVPGDRSSGISYMSLSSTSSSVSSLPVSISPNLSIGSSNRSSLEVQEEYDVPPEPRRVGAPVLRPQLPPREGKPPSCDRKEGVYDVPPQVSRDARSVDSVDCSSQRIASGPDSTIKSEHIYGTGLPLEYYSASDMLAKLQQNVHCSLEKLINFTSIASPTCTALTAEKFEESKLIIGRLVKTIQEFVRFTEGSTVNASRNGNEKLANTLKKNIEPILSTYEIVNNTWNGVTKKENALEVLKQLTNITKPLGDNVKQMAILIQTNANLIFDKNSKMSDNDKTPVKEKANKLSDPSTIYANDNNLLEDYDYVKLESRDSVEKEHQQIKESLPVSLRKSYDNLVKQSHSLVDDDHQKILSPNNTKSNKPSRLDANDKQILQFYSNQTEIHIQNLNSAIDAFFLTIEENQPPKVFIAHSKFVILSAHKLVFIGDTVHRNIVNTEIKTTVLNCSNSLCDAMKNTVSAAKTAATQFPSVSAVQAMVDSFAAISHLALKLKTAITRY